MTKYFIEDDNIEWEILDELVSRKIMAYESSLMIVKINFKKGGIGPLHNHPHVQITHVQSGVFEVSIDGEKQILKAGDAFLVPSNLIHGVQCLEAGILIDTFSPMREDFL
ncbi:cupin domain-containing protein [Daejeonella sp. H1SJ63]|jgi:quercetin dioxygenase-like cupin family protein|uniref:cupin domain-containing protein n=1 Tax=Daejeonella sp. H1SJ63 TaxID=3034145 RepID=UPI0023ED1B55|nr:cupin domain-containing protein [Daejeonella sp. H1SJ63]